MDYTFEIYELWDGNLQDPCDELSESFYTYEEAETALTGLAETNTPYVIMKVFIKEV